jgi:hypothetical protein
MKTLFITHPTAACGIATSLELFAPGPQSETALRNRHALNERRARVAREVIDR